MSCSKVFVLGELSKMKIFKIRFRNARIRDLLAVYIKREIVEKFNIDIVINKFNIMK